MADLFGPGFESLQLHSYTKPLIVNGFVYCYDS